MILGSWGILFMFNMDDLSGMAGEILGSSDKEFQRSLCWNYVPRRGRALGDVSRSRFGNPSRPGSEPW